jgi:hypothetical protein
MGYLAAFDRCDLGIYANGLFAHQIGLARYQAQL